MNSTAPFKGTTLLKTSLVQQEEFYTLLKPVRGFIIFLSLKCPFGCTSFFFFNSSEPNNLTFMMLPPTILSVKQ